MIRARSISVRLGHPARRVLDGVDASLERGRIVAIVGRNAAGKTTLLRALAGLVAPAAGDVTWDGQSPARWGARERARRIAYVAQRPSLSARFSVRDTIALGRYALPPSDARITSATRAFGLGAIAERIYQELSVGQQQRVALARAWAQVDPDGALLLDEPFAAMDLAETDRCARLLRQHARGGGLVALVLHDLNLAARLADEVVVLDQGRMVAAGALRPILTAEFLSVHFGVPFRLDADGVPEPILGGS